MTSSERVSSTNDLRSAQDSDRARVILSWILQLIAAAILLQTLFFKFTGAAESVYIFKTLGVEPWGRIVAGVSELVACILLLAPRTAAIGAAISLGVISGAIASHLTKLGIVVRDDGGLLFALALVVFFCSSAVAWIRRRELSQFARKIASGRKFLFGTRVARNSLVN